jgi:hypothetical protein
MKLYKANGVDLLQDNEILLWEAPIGVENRAI